MSAAPAPRRAQVTVHRTQCLLSFDLDAVAPRDEPDDRAARFLPPVSAVAGESKGGF